MTPKLPAIPSMHRRALRTRRDLTPAQRSLLGIMQENQFGWLEKVQVESGQAVLDGGVKVVRVTRLGGERGGAIVPMTEEFELKQAVCDLFDQLESLRNGEIVRLEFRHGLPFLLETVAVAIHEDPTSAPAILESGK
jgi:hypothetical protein